MRLVWTVMGPLWLLQMYRLSWTAHWTRIGGFSLLGNSEFYGSFWQPNTLKCNAGRQKILSKSPHATKPCTGLARPMLFNLSNIMSLWFYFTQQYLCTKWLELQVKTFAESGLPMYLACLCIWPTHLAYAGVLWYRFLIWGAEASPHWAQEEILISSPRLEAVGRWTGTLLLLQAATPKGQHEWKPPKTRSKSLSRSHGLSSVMHFGFFQASGKLLQ